MNSRLKNLRKLNTFLRNFTVAGLDCGFHYVTDQGDATTTLDKLSGDQVLLARPELHQYGDSDGYKETIDTAVFVLAKDLGAGRTQEKENDQFDRLENIADIVLEKIDDAITSGDCPLLAGFEIIDIAVVPEKQIFGSWQGYSIAITFNR